MKRREKQKRPMRRGGWGENASAVGGIMRPLSSLVFSEGPHDDPGESVAGIKKD